MAEIQSFDGYRLPLLNLVGKHRLVFNDIVDSDKNQAVVVIDLNLTCAHTLNNTGYQLTVIEARQNLSDILEDQIANA